MRLLTLDENNIWDSSDLYRRLEFEVAKAKAEVTRYSWLFKTILAVGYVMIAGMMLMAGGIIAAAAVG